MKTQQWVNELYNILNERPVARAYSNWNNTQTLIRNNQMSNDLLKSLCRGYSNKTEYHKMVLEILKKLENMSVSWVKKKVREVTDNIKESKVKRSVSSLNQTSIGRKKI